MRICSEERETMGRRHRWRRVEELPLACYYKPAEVPAGELEEVTLLVEEIEALRLKDQLGIEQEKCASQMHVSRRTFCRLLDSARMKVADALINGKAMNIQGGQFKMAMSKYKCIEGHEWQVPFETMVTSSPEYCPQCKTPSIMPVYDSGRHRHFHGGD
ncbi:MAG: DUF134 domain-containing protein [Dehalococcoidales bacterium]|nr:DUF134 domain-containing protein [Dehalococcoidales bacterium]